MTSNEIIKKLKSLTNPRNIAGMKRFGINTKNTLGISMGELEKIAKEIKKSHPEQREGSQDSSATPQNDRHKLALEIWESGIHEAKTLASMVDVPELVTENQMDSWVSDFDSWDVCDSVCGKLLDKTSFALKKSLEYVKSDKEFVKRAGFVIFTWKVVHDKKQEDKIAIDFLKIIKQNSTDERNFVRKAVNWALRTIGKKNANLNKEALKCANEIIQKYPNNKTAKWIATNATRELEIKKF